MQIEGCNEALADGLTELLGGFANAIITQVIYGLFNIPDIGFRF